MSFWAAHPVSRSRIRTRFEGSRLLAAGTRADFAKHTAQFAEIDLEAIDESFLAVLDSSGLTGRGGAGFPSGRKVSAALTAIRSSSARRRTALIANGAEGEPLSFKDQVLLTEAPHLVIDGLLALAQVFERTEVVFYVSGSCVEPVARALQERDLSHRIQLVEAADLFVAGEASAVVNAIQSMNPIPLDNRYRLSERGLAGLPTLVFNVETLAQIALIARYGAEWFRMSGSDSAPGTRLVTLSGYGLARPNIDHERHAQVVEVPMDLTPAEVLTDALPDNDVRDGFLLLGGYHGSWCALPADKNSEGPRVRQESSFSSGMIYALSRGECGLEVTSGIVSYLAQQSARQCGPCRFGLPALAGIFEQMLEGAGAARSISAANRLANRVSGRGACHHPDGTARLVGSALRVFRSEIEAHASGRCTVLAAEA